VWHLMLFIQRHWHLARGYYTRHDGTVIASALAVTIIGLLTAALVQSM